MAISLNRVQLIGNLGADPDLRSTPSGKSVCTLSIATTESYKDKNGEWQSNTEWHKVEMWERLAEIAKQYLTKGSKVFIEGKIKTDTYEQNGVTKYFTKVLAQNMIMMGSADKSSDYNKDNFEGGNVRFNKPKADQNDTDFNPAKFENSDANGADDDDLPF